VFSQSDPHLVAEAARLDGQEKRFGDGKLTIMRPFLDLTFQRTARRQKHAVALEKMSCLQANQRAVSNRGTLSQCLRRK